MKHALIIEDNAIIAGMIRDFLLDYGYNSVDLASTQAEAIQLAGQRCPDLVTADDRLEQGSGIEAIQYICQDRSIPVLFLVADSTNLRMLLPNADFLLKPFSESALDNAIQMVEKLAVARPTTARGKLCVGGDSACPEPAEQKHARCQRSPNGKEILQHPPSRP